MAVNTDGSTVDVSLCETRLEAGTMSATRRSESDGYNLPSAHSGRSTRSRVQSFFIPILLGLLCLVVYNANLRQIGAGDTIPARYLPLNIWRYATLRLDPIMHWVAHGHSITAPWNRPQANARGVKYYEPRAYWIAQSRSQHPVSLYPVVAPILVAPLYLPAVAYLHNHGWQQPEVDRVAEIMEKLSASLLAALAVISVYLLLRREGGRWSLGLALAFAFATNTWMISSQALWQHGAGELLIALALLLVVSTATPARLAMLGGVCVLIAGNRPPDALIAGAILAYVVWNRWRNTGWLLLGSALPLGLLLYYNLGVIGDIAGGYGVADTHATAFFKQSIWPGIAGLLLSPARGLLIFSPFLAFVAVGLWPRLRMPRTRALSIFLSFAVVAQLLVYARVDWRAGFSWGPRYFTDLLPIFVWMLAPVSLVLRGIGRGLLILTIVASAGVQAIGAFWYNRASDEAIFAGGSASMAAAWNFNNVPFLAELRHPRPRAELLCDASGSIDRIGGILCSNSGDLSPVIPSGSLLEGSVIACGGGVPAQLLALVDGIVVGSTGNFSKRAETDAASHKASGFAWSIPADLRGVQPGEHTLQLGIQIDPRSDIRIVREQRIRVVTAKSPAAAPELDAMAQTAVSTLRRHQSDEGYWLTSYTAKRSFEAAQPEMNTFLTAIMIDFLSPVAERHGIGDVIDRARRNLGAQIETNGLVRYHGLPNGSTIGRLGCVISPDADDTALAWRIAPPEGSDSRRQQMLATLANYRDDRGFYRTWLAAPDRYECIDPGSNPNPADATIQMHVYMMLREMDSAAAADLCRALEQHIVDPDLWVYYTSAPLVPFLRGAELRQQGCSIPLLTDRLRTAPPGQENWNEVARRLVATMAPGSTPNDRRSIFDLLEKLGRDDFAELRHTPPLLYHNDLTAKVSRYYWSEDFGYALWLRLYDTVGNGADTSTSDPK